jgi:hypothetical protein
MGACCKAVRMPFRLSFHLVLLGPSGAHWLDYAADLSKDSTRQHAVDDSLLSCNELLIVC